MTLRARLENHFIVAAGSNFKAFRGRSEPANEWSAPRPRSVHWAHAASVWGSVLLRSAATILKHALSVARWSRSPGRGLSQLFEPATIDDIRIHPVIPDQKHLKPCCARRRTGALLPTISCPSFPSPFSSLRDRDRGNPNLLTVKTLFISA
jgi:hypothetical protein